MTVRRWERDMGHPKAFFARHVAFHRPWESTSMAVIHWDKEGNIFSAAHFGIDVDYKEILSALTASWKEFKSK